MPRPTDIVPVNKALLERTHDLYDYIGKPMLLSKGAVEGLLSVTEGREQEEEFFCGAQAKIYIGDTWVEDIASISFTYGQNKTPIYSYDDQFFQAVGKGNYLVQGNFMLALRDVGYINIILSRYYNMYMGGPVLPGGDPFSIDTKNIGEKLALGGTDFDEAADLFEMKMWGLDAYSKDIREYLSPDMLDYVTDTDVAGVTSDYIGDGFDIVVYYGKPGEGHSTSFTIQGAHIINDAQVITYDETPIGILIEFFARNTGIGRNILPRAVTEDYELGEAEASVETIQFNMHLRDLELPTMRGREGLEGNPEYTDGFVEMIKTNSDVSRIAKQYKGRINKIEIINEAYITTATDDDITSAENVQWMSAPINEEVFFTTYIEGPFTDAYNAVTGDSSISIPQMSAAAEAAMAPAGSPWTATASLANGWKKRNIALAIARAYDTWDALIPTLRAALYAGSAEDESYDETETTGSKSAPTIVRKTTKYVGVVEEDPTEFVSETVTGPLPEEDIGDYNIGVTQFTLYPNERFLADAAGDQGDVPSVKRRVEATITLKIIAEPKAPALKEVESD